ncbi:MAG: DUF2264 domain-containing protein [Candidatus Synoicihabitans palmerolidicus]|nr:DUF2264 domain-containing protein [Candidatus Synoicihabitans palmerolidicus]
MPSIDRRKFMKVAAIAGTSAYFASHLQLSATSAPSGTVVSRRGTDAYRHWQAEARALLEPLTRLFQPGRASLDIAGPHSACGAPADRLETFARPLLLTAHYLRS